MPTVLDDALITDTLKSLPGWEGGPDGIWRDVHLTAEQDVELRRQVAVDGASMGHQPLVESVDGGTRFTLSTPESGGVTELDIAFASHLSDLAHTLAGNEPGVDAVRAGDPVVVFRAPEETGISPEQP